MATVTFDRRHAHLPGHRPAGRRPTSTWRSTTASSSCSSGRRGAASRRRCGCSPGSSRSTRARSTSATATSPTVPPKDRDIAMVFQSYALYPHMTVAENIGFHLKVKRVPKAERAERVREAAAHPRPRAVPRPQAGQAVGRPAPAGGDGPGDRPPAAGVPDGRAAVEPRRQAARADPHADRRPAAPPRRHDGVRHPRPGRGDDDGRPRRRARRRRAAAVRHAEGPVHATRSTCSSPGSSARRR